MRKIWGERDARACVKAAKAAGLGLGAWAREHGVDGRSLHAWAVNLGLVARPVAKPTLIELVPMPAPPTVARYVTDQRRRDARSGRARVSSPRSTVRAVSRGWL
jgi:hypothetical protein